jgi:hypothetical protein
MSHTILITTHKWKMQKNHLNPKWGISIKLGQILRCIFENKMGGGRRIPWESIREERYHMEAPEGEIEGGVIDLDSGVQWRKKRTGERKKKGS